MAVYFFALSNGEKLCNGQGAQFVNDMAAQRFAVSSARDLMSDQIMTGSLDLRERIDVSDASGTVRFSVKFSDAVEVIGSSNQ